MLIQKETTVTTKEEFSIELPYYTKGIAHAYKVVDEDHAIQVTYPDSFENHKFNAVIGVGIRVCYVSHALDQKQCTKEEFDEIYLKVLNYIQNAAS